MPINLKLFDIDGCLFHSYPKGDDMKNQKKWLVDTNKTFFEDLFAEIKENKYEKVILGVGTNRQSFSWDLELNGRGGFAMPAFVILSHYFSKNLSSCDVVFDPFLMADIYAKKQTAGTAYFSILEQILDMSKDIVHAHWIFDTFKPILIGTHAARVAAKYPKEKIVIDFYDDREDILTTVGKFFKEYDFLLPKNVTLNLHEYGKNLSKAKKIQSIEGTGEIDLNYEWIARFIAMEGIQGFKDWDESKDKLPTWKDLYNFHIDNQYFQDRDYTDNKQVNCALINVNKLMKFKKEELSNLTEYCTLGTIEYITAKDVEKKKLMLPEQYDFTKDLEEKSLFEDAIFFDNLPLPSRPTGNGSFLSFFKPNISGENISGENDSQSKCLLS